MFFSFVAETGFDGILVEIVAADVVVRFLGVEEIADAVAIDGFEEECGVALDLEEPSAVVGGCGDEVVPGLAVRLGIGIRRL
jgi:hypothetical protein